MKQEQITAKLPAKGDRLEQSATVSVNCPETLQEAVQMAGSEDVVLSNAWASHRITVQSAIRRGLEAGKSVENIQAELADVKMGQKLGGGGRVDPITASLDKFKTMSKEEQAAFLNQLKQAAGK